MNYLMKKEYNTGRSWHPRFEEYTESIVSHPTYKGLYFERDKNGRVKWVVTGKSAKGLLREKWWKAQCKKHNIPLRKGCYAIVARLIHPTKRHVCQCCGKELSIFYEYPNKYLLSDINSTFGWKLEQTSFTIKEIIKMAALEKYGLSKISQLLKVPEGLTETEIINYVYDNMVATNNRIFSPGVMSNCPDRYDGFHSDGLCCREETDKGRHKGNMKTYTQDRRAYEEWSDGDYNLANRLMGEFNKQEPIPCPICGRIKKMTADHIGPISLGFCHSKNFTPLCNSCNSSKNNRFTKNDVDELLRIEERGEQVVSWHSKAIWDALKHTISNDSDAKFASSIMAKCHQNVLNILSIIYQKTGQEFLLRYLHPEYSLVDYRFENVDLLNLDGLRIISTPLDSKNKRKNQDRYIRIAFESLEDFSEKKNRKNYFLINENSDELSPIIQAIRLKKYELADIKLRHLIENVSNSILEKEKSERLYRFEDINSDYFIAAEPE